MSELQASIVSVNNTTNAAAAVVGNGVINAVGIHLGSGPGVNTSAVFVNSTSGLLTANIDIPSITVGTQVDFLETVNTQTFTSNGTWTKPSWATDGKELVVAHLWGGGGGGSLSGGGGGGAFVFGYFIANNLGATEAVVVGTAGIEDAGILATAGGNSSFAGLVAYGGGPATTNASANPTVQAGSGGGWSAAGSNTAAGGPIGGTAASKESTFGGGFGGNTSVPSGGQSIYGGGGGGVTAGAGGNSVFGGGGGGPSTATGAGFSLFGGRGSNSISAATAPGGGGSASPSNGAIGEVRVYTYRITS